MQKQCLHCNTVFTVKRKDKVYCSHSCRQMAYIHRRVGEEASTFSFKPIETSTQSVINNKQNVNTLSETSTPCVNKAIGSSSGAIENTSYTYVESQWMEELKQRYAIESEPAHINYQNENIRWVCIRYRSLLECLLTLSNLKRIKWEDMAELSNAFTFLTGTSYFKQLPSYYPYTQYALFLRDRLKIICEDNGGEAYINFRLKFETRKELIYQRYEIAQIYPKMTFVEIIADFTELHQKEQTKLQLEKQQEQLKSATCSKEHKPWRKRYNHYLKTGRIDLDL